MANRLPPDTRDPRENLYGALPSVCGAIVWAVLIVAMIWLLERRPALFAAYAFSIGAFILFALISALL